MTAAGADAGVGDGSAPRTGARWQRKRKRVKRETMRSDIP